MILATENIRSFLDVPRESGVISEDEWFKKAPDLILEDTPDFSETISEQVSYLLNDYPTEHIRDLLVRVLSDDYDHAVITELRFMRKVIMVGRDSLRLATTTLDEEHPLRSMGRLTGRLGILIDAIEEKSQKDIDKSGQATWRSLSKLEQVGAYQTGVAESNQAIAMQVSTALNGQNLLTSFAPDTVGEIDENRYHHARRLFRSVVHLGITSSLLYPNAEKDAYVREGIELSAKYGNNHDALLASSVNVTLSDEVL